MLYIGSILSDQKITYDNSKQYTEVLNFLAVLLEFNEILQYDPKEPAYHSVTQTSSSGF